MQGTKTKATKDEAIAHSAASASGSPQSDLGTITSALAAQPDLAPSKAAKRLFPDAPAWKRAILRFQIKGELEEGRGSKWNWHKGAVHASNIEPNDDELQGVRKRFGYKTEQEGGPSRLYTMILADAVLPLPRSPMCAVLSPPLLASTGITPFSIFSTGPDIIQHYYDCIVAAQQEVILLTNYWQTGKNVDRIADALRDLNAKHAKRREERYKKEANRGDSIASDEKEAIELKTPKPTLAEQIIVKIMWDRGPQTLADLFRLRKPVPPTMWKENGLPTKDEVPFLNVEIINYHRPLMGTFHAKLLLVDRQVALVNSNNIQDRPNIESCVRLEGDIVNSVYDHALISWGNTLVPPLPCLGSPAPKTPSPAAFSSGAGSSLPVLTPSRLRELAHVARKRLQKDDEETEILEEKYREHTIGGSRRMSFADVIEGVIRRDSSGQVVAQTPTTTTISASEGDMTAMPTQEKNFTTAEKERAAKKAGSEWARKVLGDRFKANQSPTATSVAIPQDDIHNRRHFADVVAALMEKEGNKPPLWAEGALDTFGLGPSSSRNVSEEAKRSRGASKGVKVIVPEIVTEEAQGEKCHERTLVESSDGDCAPMKGIEKENEKDNRRSESIDATNTQSTLAVQSGFSLKHDSSNAGRRDEGAPGARAYLERQHSSLSVKTQTTALEQLAQITKSLDFANLSRVKGEITAERLAAMTPQTEKELELGNHGDLDVLQFNPFIFHSPHAPVPMALVNRRPHGTPGHSDIRNPQDAAWLAGFRYAKKHIFLQTPTLNATPIKHAILHTARRHVRIEVYLGLGFNDKSESMPFQGGTNEKVVTKLYRQLRREGKGDEKYLEIYWYTGKDMFRPLNAVRKQRNCHVKYISFDGQVAITGSGNMDTQSWFHSQEINVMVDSAQIVSEWDAGLKRNQSTGLYGRVDSDGIWRGRSGSERVDKGGDK